nr:spore germination protein [Bacillus thermotolerans]
MLFFRKNNKESGSSRPPNQLPHQGSISSNFMDNVEEARSLFYDTPDLVVRHLVIQQTKSQAALIYLSGITDSKTIFNHVLSPLIFEDIRVSLGHIKEASTWPQIESAILNGESVLFVDGRTEAFIYDTSFS